MEQEQLTSRIGEDLWLARHLEETAVSRPNSDTSVKTNEAGSGVVTAQRSLYLGHSAHTGSISDLVTWSATLGEPVRGVVVSNALSPEPGRSTFVRVTTDDRRGLLVALTEHLKAQQVCGTSRVGEATRSPLTCLVAGASCLSCQPPCGRRAPSRWTPSW